VRPPSLLHTTRGFTLLELAIALLLMTSLWLLALPAWRAWIARAERMDLAERLAASLALARSEAMKHGSRVNLCKSPDGVACRTSGGWESGWLVYLDDDRDGALAPGEAVLRHEVPPPRGLTARANRPLADYVSFTALGHARLLNGALQMGTFTVCRAGEPALHVVLANTGRVRIEDARERCA
jgi:type IV fimbrial biogenesis protein FimT